MPIIKLKTFIKAPIDMCFDLARNVEIHTKTTSHTNERAVGGVTTGRGMKSSGRPFILV